MPKKKKENELTPDEQFKRFRETANELEIDEKDKPLEKAFENLTSNQEPSNRAKGPNQ
jgi:hypothetical protein